MQLAPAFAALAALSLAAGIARGEGAPVVVELFTSQGCASCPPADDMLRDLVAVEGVIPLALHVDYWDYIGWEDTFGSALFTARQQSYAVAAGERMVYTPQLIVGGTDRVIGADPMAVMALVAAQAEQAPMVTLTLVREGGGFVIAADSAERLAQPVVVQLVRFLPLAQVEILGGENAGQTHTYANVVTDWQVLGDWDGAAPLSLTTEAPGDEPAVVILQEPGPGRIIAAAELR